MTDINRKTAQRTVWTYILAATIACAYSCGFIIEFHGYDFERLHIFLLNLCAGGSTIIIFTDRNGSPSPGAKTFYVLSLMFAFSSFFEIYPASVLLAVILGIIVERIRQSHFPVIPVDFFRKDSSTARIFHHASLLCLSAALFLSAAVVINDKWLGLFHFRKLTLNVFFLGFSFPVSLATFSLIFSLTEEDSPLPRIASRILFWTITAGVIVFFLFIIIEWKQAQMRAAIVLAMAVSFLFILYMNHGKRVRQKVFLLSGMGFLMATAVTGILYIVLTRAGYAKPAAFISLKAHSFLSLYGWNMTGLFLIIKGPGIPGMRVSRKLIAAHWLIAGILSPLASFVTILSIPACFVWTVFLLLLFSDTGSRQN